MNAEISRLCNCLRKGGLGIEDILFPYFIVASIFHNFLSSPSILMLIHKPEKTLSRALRKPIMVFFFVAKMYFPHNPWAWGSSRDSQEHCHAGVFASRNVFMPTLIALDSGGVFGIPRSS